MEGPGEPFKLPVRKTEKVTDNRQKLNIPLSQHVGPPDLPTVHTPQLTFISLKKIEAKEELTLPDKPFINTVPVHNTQPHQKITEKKTEKVNYTTKQN